MENSGVPIQSPTAMRTASSRRLLGCMESEARHPLLLSAILLLLLATLAALLTNNPTTGVTGVPLESPANRASP